MLPRTGAAAPCALTVPTAFTDLWPIAFGAFTRLTDSGLGCPDWPGCYGQASQWARRHPYRRRASRAATGPVTHGRPGSDDDPPLPGCRRGVLCIVLLRPELAAARRGGVNRPGLLAALTLERRVLPRRLWRAVMMKLFPAIVEFAPAVSSACCCCTVLRAEGLAARPLQASPHLRAGLWVLLAAVAAGEPWAVGSAMNYAVLACDGFPSCRGGSRWPTRTLPGGFTLWRELGTDGAGISVSRRSSPSTWPTAWARSSCWRPGLAGLRLRARGPTRPLPGSGVWRLAVSRGAVQRRAGWPLVAALAHTSGAAMPAGRSVSLLARLHAGGASATFDLRMATTFGCPRRDRHALAAVLPADLPRVVQLVVVLARHRHGSPCLDCRAAPRPLTMLVAVIGIWLVAAAPPPPSTCTDRGWHRRARMKRTAWRATARAIPAAATPLLFSALLAGAGMAPAGLGRQRADHVADLATFVGYAVIYTVVLKPMTPAEHRDRRRLRRHAAGAGWRRCAAN